MLVPAVGGVTTLTILYWKSDFFLQFKTPNIWTNSSPSYFQGFIQAILMSGRWHKKLNLLIWLSNSIFINLILKYIGIELAIKINYLIKFQAIYLSSWSKKAKTSQRFYLAEPLPVLHHKPVVELTVPQEP